MDTLQSSRAQRLIGLIHQYGWPVTKASYVKAMDYPYPTQFPLDAEIVAMVPRELHGSMPTSERDLSFPRRPAPKSPSLPPDGRRLDDDLVSSTALRHGFTYEQAEAELKRFGG